MSATVERRGRVTMRNDLFFKTVNVSFYNHILAQWSRGQGYDSRFRCTRYQVQIMVNFT